MRLANTRLAAARFLQEYGTPIRDEREPQDVHGYWISDPAGVVLLLTAHSCHLVPVGGLPEAVTERARCLSNAKALRTGPLVPLATFW